MKISVVIPVFNEASTVRTLLQQVWHQTVPSCQKELIIVESNSTDGTREIVQRFVAEHQNTASGEITLVLQEKARGKGSAVRQGLKSATGDIILIQDGDLEYDVKDYPALVTPILEGKADFVLGSRHLSAGTWKIRKFESNPVRGVLLNFGGILFHGFFNLLYGTHLSDPTTMFKVFRRSCLQDFDLVSNRFDFDFELVAKLIRAGYPPIEVPVSYTSRGFSEGKKVSIFRDPLTWVRAIVRFRFAPMRSRELAEPMSSAVSAQAKD